MEVLQTPALTTSPPRRTHNLTTALPEPAILRELDFSYTILNILSYNMRLTEWKIMGSVEKDGFINRKNVGTAVEVGGAVYGIWELAHLDVGGGIVGGLIYLLGKWIKNSGEKQH